MSCFGCVTAVEAKFEQLRADLNALVVAINEVKALVNNVPVAQLKTLETVAHQIDQAQGLTPIKVVEPVVINQV